MEIEQGYATLRPDVHIMKYLFRRWWNGEELSEIERSNYYQARASYLINERPDKKELIEKCELECYYYSQRAIFGTK